MKISKKYKPEAITQESLKEAYPSISELFRSVIISLLKLKYGTTEMYLDDERLIEILEKDESEIMDIYMAL